MTDSEGKGWGQWVALTLLAVGWIAGERVLAHHMAGVLPDGIKRHLVLQSYLALVQVTALTLGLGAAFLVLRRPKEAFALTAPSGRSLALAPLFAPIVFIGTGWLAFEVAKPTLLEELLRGGRQHAEDQSGEFGRAMTQTQAILTLAWGAMIAPIVEELVFRGALWSAVQGFIDRLRRPEPKAASLPSDFIEESSVLKAARRIGAFFAGGFVATLATTAVFAVLHMDMPGGAGIMRWVSAACIGLAMGTARHLTGTISVPIVLHVLFNLASIASTRRWLVFESLGNKATMPLVLWYLAGACGVALLVLGVAALLRRPAERPS